MSTTVKSAFALCALLAAAGCATDPEKAREFRTSGSREADQRAEQRVARTQQMRGEEAADADDGKDAPQQSLFERLGGDEGLRRIVEDFVPRVIADPRTNWERKGVTRGGVLGIGAKSAEWKATGENVERLKRHLAQFLAVASGGPARYEGRELGAVHKGMAIANVEFDASVGVMKATLDNLGVGTVEQRELLAILESARPLIAEKR
ncbi:MAG TPA: group 1 truncated hemoglobin [Planctomycetota bacterium]|nr:group 1 truncated hemoglobin [Planctomycetota bacterium]